MKTSSEKSDLKRSTTKSSVSDKNENRFSDSNRSVSGLGKQSGYSENENKKETDGLRELFINELKDIYWAEKALIQAIPKMIKKVTSGELSEALSNHLSETEEQAKRIEKVFHLLNEEPKTKKCQAMKGLIDEAGDIMDETEEGVVRDAGIISAAQKVEHYEIASYGTLRTFATLLGENEAASLLEETLNEEKNADETLTKIAETVNAESVH